MSLSMKAALDEKAGAGIELMVRVLAMANRSSHNRFTCESHNNDRVEPMNFAEQSERRGSPAPPVDKNLGTL